MVQNIGIGETSPQGTLGILDARFSTVVHFVPTSHHQVVIIGGGICGLWLLAALRRDGYDAILLERDHLGGAQTLASQGMIHGGIKYSLGGFTTPASESIAAMPSRWRDCIAGSGSLDLRGVRILSEDYYLFSDERLSSRVAAFFGSRSVRGRIDTVARADYPPAFANESFKGMLYRLEDLVIDTHALVRKLWLDHREVILQADPRLEFNDDGSVSALTVDGQHLSADRYILAAGAGNEGLMSTSPRPVEMQRRPLKQVMVRHRSLPTVFAHAVSAAAGTKPRVTITTHALGNGDAVWYLGGNLAETGVERSDEAQLAEARHEIDKLFSWLDLDGAQWRTFEIDRAEAAQSDRSRPDTPHVKEVGNCIVCWPTKLTLTPLLADEVLAMVPPARAIPDAKLPDLPQAEIADAPWERAYR